MAKITGPETAPAPTPTLISALIAEAFGTFVLVFGVIGTALFSSSNTGWLGVSLAIGLAVFVAIYTVGHISGGHFNPAVTLGLALAGRFGWGRVWQYAAAQIVGGIVATSSLYLIANGGPEGFVQDAVEGGFASNGFGEHSPAGFGLTAVIGIEIVLTAVFLFVILGVTDPRNPTALVGLVIGLTLTVLHLVAIPVSNASFNPARSIATAIYGGPDALAQLIVFIIAPLIGAAIAGVTYKALFARDKA
jgi:aquaporin Z